MKALIIGLGNDYRSDDGVGRVVARRLRAELLDEVGILEETGEGAALIEAWRGANCVILIDAVHSGGEPGTIYRIDANEQQIPRSFFHYSTHAFNVAEAVEMARALGQLPRRLVIYGIEGKNFASGTFVPRHRRGSGRNGPSRESRAMHEFSPISVLMRKIRAIAREPISSWLSQPVRRASLRSGCRA